MYSFKYTHSTCKCFIEIKSQIDDYCLSVRNDETRICKKYLFAVLFWKTVMSDQIESKYQNDHGCPKRVPTWQSY